MASRLERSSSLEEIQVVFFLANDKTPGPDGYMKAFFQECWDIIAKDLLKVLVEFHQIGKIGKAMNKLL